MGEGDLSWKAGKHFLSLQAPSCWVYSQDQHRKGSGSAREGGWGKFGDKVLRGSSFASQCSTVALHSPCSWFLNESKLWHTNLSFLIHYLCEVFYTPRVVWQGCPVWMYHLLKRNLNLLDSVSLFRQPGTCLYSVSVGYRDGGLLSSTTDSIHVRLLHHKTNQSFKIQAEMQWIRTTLVKISFGVFFLFLSILELVDW